MKRKLFEYRVVLSHDEETGNFVVEVPALAIADYGGTFEEALQHIQEMLSFHLECLIEEEKPIPEESARKEGLFIHVRAPVHAA